MSWVRVREQYRKFLRSFKRMSPLVLEGIKRDFIKYSRERERWTESESNRSKGMEAGYYNGSIPPLPGIILTNDSYDP